ncbi:alpha/beta hydrolase domain-containing protein [Microbacterium sp. No. 7]|uniref:alpha/beta hydrolase domain-containing protein n=1 Tax=Microbacterium sp. No. 7 TaxID=1714373 RepID=UPI0006ED1A92|nr:hypothetical protein AOA12_19110 [Microbacterium sp. No. 7]
MRERSPAALPRSAARRTVTAPGNVASRPSEVDMLPAMEAAQRRMREWVSAGVVPPAHPRIEMDADGKVVRDEDGIARGGVRLPDVEAPVAAYYGGGRGPGTVGIAGKTEPFSDERIHERYRTHEGYVAAVNAAARKALEQGVILEEHLAEYDRRAKDHPFPA